MGEIIPFPKLPKEKSAYPPSSTPENMNRLIEELLALRVEIEKRRAWLFNARKQEPLSEKRAAIDEQLSELYELSKEIPIRTKWEEVQDWETYWLLRQRAERALGRDVHSDNVLELRREDEGRMA